MIASGLLDVIDLSILLNSLATVYIDAILYTICTLRYQ